MYSTAARPNQRKAIERDIRGVIVPIITRVQPLTICIGNGFELDIQPYGVYLRVGKWDHFYERQRKRE